MLQPDDDKLIYHIDYDIVVNTNQACFAWCLINQHATTQYLLQLLGAFVAIIMCFCGCPFGVFLAEC